MFITQNYAVKFKYSLEQILLFKVYNFLALHVHPYWFWLRLSSSQIQIPQQGDFNLALLPSYWHHLKSPTAQQRRITKP